MYFCQIFWFSKLFSGRGNVSQKGITGQEFGSQYHYQTGIWLSNIITGRELGSQISLPDMSLAVNIF